MFLVIVYECWVQDRLSRVEFKWVRCQSYKITILQNYHGVIIEQLILQSPQPRIAIRAVICFGMQTQILLSWITPDRIVLYYNDERLDAVSWDSRCYRGYT